MIHENHQQLLTRLLASVVLQRGGKCNSESVASREIGLGGDLSRDGRHASSSIPSLNCLRDSRRAGTVLEESVMSAMDSSTRARRAIESVVRLEQTRGDHSQERQCRCR